MWCDFFVLKVVYINETSKKGFKPDSKPIIHLTVKKEIMKSLITLLFLLALALPAISHPTSFNCCSPDETIVLTSRDSGKVGDEAETSIQQNIKAAMVGTWESSVYPFALKKGKENVRLEGAYLRYTFNPDGTYLINYGDAETHLEEEGAWNISANGKQIELKAEHATKSQTILIKYLELDELVLLHDFVNRNKPFNPGDKSVFFHKA